MEVPPRLQALCEEMRQEFGAERLYVVDIDDAPTDDLAGLMYFGMREASVPALAAQARAGKVLQTIIEKPVGVEMFTNPENEVEYVFDRYLRPYIATHGGIVTIERIDEPGGQLLINMDGGCSGCPSSIATLKHGSERTLKKHLPWVSRVDSTTEAAEPDFNINLDFSTLKDQ